jgi:hypothetical protein
MRIHQALLAGAMAEASETDRRNAAAMLEGARTEMVRLEARVREQWPGRRQGLEGLQGCLEEMSGVLGEEVVGGMQIAFVVGEGDVLGALLGQE